MIIIKSYGRREDDTGRTYILSYEKNVCPVCGHALIVIGTRGRKYIDDNGIKEILVIRRLRCKDCRAIHHELPDILIPYKRHCANTVEKIIADEVSGLCCEEGTIRKIRTWWAACRLYFESVIVSLREKYGVAFPAAPAPREIARATANANLWVHTRSAFLSG